MVVPATPLDGLDSSQAEMMEELVLCLDSEDNVIDTSSKLATHHGEGILHRAFSVLFSILKEDYCCNRDLLIKSHFQPYGPTLVVAIHWIL